MPRPNRDRTPAAGPNKRTLTENFLKKLKPQSRKFVVWDSKQRGLAVLVQPTGFKSWKCVYSRHGRPRWYHIGAVDAFGLDKARKSAARVMYEVSEGKDPAAERKADRIEGTFEELVTRYFDEHAKKRHKSWKQSELILKFHTLPRLGKMMASQISRADIRNMHRRIEAPISANQALAHTRAVFSWAVKQDLLKANPCAGVEKNQTKERERVLSDSEIPLFWKAFDDAGYVRSLALKMVLLTGQRPGEVRHMRTEHIKDGWWEMPGAPVPALNWPGTKNGATHRVYLCRPALDILEELEPKGGVFAGPRGRAIGKIDEPMRAISKALSVDPATPHDLRRTHGTTITSLGFGRDAMNRIQNHKEGGIASVYDRHEYAAENKKIMEAVASRIMTLVEGGPANVVEMPIKKKA
jgi:integrase